MFNGSLTFQPPDEDRPPVTVVWDSRDAFRYRELAEKRGDLDPDLAAAGLNGLLAMGYLALIRVGQLDPDTPFTRFATTWYLTAGPSSNGQGALEGEQGDLELERDFAAGEVGVVPPTSAVPGGT